MNFPPIRTFSILLLGAALLVGAQERPEAVSPGRARANFDRPIALGPDDIRVLPEAPEGFKTPRAGNPPGKLEVFEYDSGVTGTRRKANVYLPPGYSPARNPTPPRATRATDCPASPRTAIATTRKRPSSTSSPLTGSSS